MAVFCLSLLMLNGPLMAQSCGTVTFCHLLSSYDGEENDELSSRVNFHPFSRVRSLRCAQSEKGIASSAAHRMVCFIMVL